MAVAASSRPFTSHIQTGFCFFAYINSNAEVVIAGIQTYYDVIIVTTSGPFLSYIQADFCIFACKNYNISLAATSIPIDCNVIEAAANILADYDTIVVVASGLFPSHIQAGFYFSTYKNYNTKAVIADVPVIEAFYL